MVQTTKISRHVLKHCIIEVKDLILFKMTVMFEKQRSVSCVCESNMAKGQRRVFVQMFVFVLVRVKIRVS